MAGIGKNLEVARGSNLNSFEPQNKQQYNHLVDVESNRAVAEVQAAALMAKRFPRDTIVALDRIINSCMRKGLAEKAMYSYSRGGSEVTGASIRLAETIAQNWGNMQFGIKELEQSNGESTVEAFAWDIETNTYQSKIFKVQHVRYTKNGSKQLQDPRDIYEHVANNGARRLRACILGIIPIDIVEAAIEQCEATLATTADTTPEALKKLVEAFSEFGVTQKQIEKRIQCRLDAIKSPQVVNLRKIYMSLRDGMATAESFFEPEEKKATPEPAPQQNVVEQEPQQQPPQELDF